jgi:hypothetical protein
MKMDVFDPLGEHLETKVNDGRWQMAFDILQHIKSCEVWRRSILISSVR